MDDREYDEYLKYLEEQNKQYKIEQEKEQFHKRKIFGTKLKQLRESKGYRRSYVAAQLQISQSAIVFYENGERLPTIENLKKLSNLFDVTTDYLLDTDGVENDKFEYACNFWQSLGLDIIESKRDNDDEIHLSNPIEIIFPAELFFLIDDDDEFGKQQSVSLGFNDKCAFITYTNFVESKIAKKIQDLKKEIGIDYLKRAFGWSIQHGQTNISKEIFPAQYQFTES